jgi:hypothetical protein
MDPISQEVGMTLWEGVEQFKSIGARTYKLTVHGDCDNIISALDTVVHDVNAKIPQLVVVTKLVAEVL